MSDTERDAFEAWCKGFCTGLLLEDDAKWAKLAALDAWQAATEQSKRQPLTVREVEQILHKHNYELHGDRARYIVRTTEAAHGITAITRHKGDCQMSCCTQGVFMDDFHYYWSKYFNQPPTAAQLKRAKKDWREGSTGCEGVLIAKELETYAADTLEKPLVNIGSKNYAVAGSNLALKFGKPATPQGKI